MRHRVRYCIGGRRFEEITVPSFSPACMMAKLRPGVRIRGYHEWPARSACRNMRRRSDPTIDASILARLTATKEIGISSVGHRRKLFVAAARLLANDGRRAPELELAATEAERRHLTIMFLDFVGSTELSRSLDPEDMRQVILRYQQAVFGEITRLKGHVAKFIGDGVLAYFAYLATVTWHRPSKKGMKSKEQGDARSASDPFPPRRYPLGGPEVFQHVLRTVNPERDVNACAASPVSPCNPSL